MSGRVEEILNGNFDRTGTGVEFSVHRLECDVELSEVAQGHFFIRPSSKGVGEIFFHSTDWRLSITYTGKHGDSIRVDYAYNSAGLEESVRKGELTCICALGEYSVPFLIRIHPTRSSFKGQLPSDLFSFTNLARSDFKSACELFYSGDIHRVFGNDNTLWMTYCLYSRKKHSCRNVDEFLIEVRKKEALEFHCEISEDEGRGESGGIISVIKSGWGYVDIDIYTDSSFVNLERTHLSIEDFENNQASVRYSIEREKLHPGKNSACCTLKDFHNQVEIPIYALRPSRKREGRWTARRRRFIDLARHYISSRVRRVSGKAWASSSMYMVDTLIEEDENDVEARLLQAWMLILCERESDAGFVLNHLEGACENDMDCWGFYLYLRTLCPGEGRGAYEARAQLETLYDRHRSSTSLALLEYMMDKDLEEEPRLLFRQLVSLYRSGVNSPILFIEALELIIKAPAVVRTPEPLYFMSIFWGIRHGLMDRRLLNTLTFLSSKEADFNPVLMKCLDGYYAEKETVEAVGSACMHLIKTHETGEKYFKWFRSAVRMQLRITRLYEYYLSCLPADFKGVLERPVLMYFCMNPYSGMPVATVGRVYANMIIHEEETADLLEKYRENITQFAGRAAMNGLMDSSLSVVYDYIYNTEEGESREAFGRSLGTLVFTHQIIVNNPGIRMVSVMENGFVRSRSCPVSAGEAYVPIYGYDYRICFEDSYGNCIKCEDYTDTALFRRSRFVQLLLEMEKEDVGISYYMCGGGRKAGKVSAVNAGSVQVILSSKSFTWEFKNGFLRSMLDYYYNEGNYEKLDGVLELCDEARMSREERSMLIDYLSLRGMQRRSYEILRRYGPEGADNRMLVRLLSRMVKERINVEDPELIELCYYVFSHGKYDEEILRFLNDNYTASARILRDIWKAASDFGLETQGIEEKLLTQMLNSDRYVGEKDEIFKSYVKNGVNSGLIQAWAYVFAYDYFVNEAIISDVVFKELLGSASDDMPDIVKLALLSRYSGESIPKERRDLLSSFISRFVKRGVVFEFFMNYSDMVSSLALFNDCTFLVYRTTPHRRVQLLRRDGEKDGYIRQILPEVCDGVYTMFFVLFADEEFSYSICEGAENEETVTESGKLKGGLKRTEPGGRFELINDMIKCESRSEYKNLMGIADLYIRKSSAVSGIFRRKP